MSDPSQSAPPVPLSGAWTARSAPPLPGASGLAESRSTNRRRRPMPARTAPGALCPAAGAGTPDPAARTLCDAAGRGPRGSSQRAPGEQRYDEVGYAGVGFDDASITGLHASLTPDTLVEVTSLENGKTIVVLITGVTAPGTRGPIDLSSGAARALGHDGAGRSRCECARSPQVPAICWRCARAVPQRRGRIRRRSCSMRCASISARRSSHAAPAPSGATAWPTTRPPRCVPAARAARGASGRHRDRVFTFRSPHFLTPGTRNRLHRGWAGS
jgi:rare lipoprotein A